MCLPFASYTDKELVSLLLTKDDLTELELELSHRLEKLMDEVAEYEDDA